VRRGGKKENRFFLPGRDILATYPILLHCGKFRIQCFGIFFHTGDLKPGYASGLGIVQTMTVSVPRTELFYADTQECSCDAHTLGIKSVLWAASGKV